MRQPALVLLLAALPVLAAERPRLGVLLVVDQLSAETFSARLPTLKAGVKRMVAEGLRVEELRYEAAPTITSVGHATLSTGAWGEVHGIVSNEWIDGETGKARLSTEDPAYAVIGRDAGSHDGTAPTALRAPTLSESLKASREGAKSLVVSGKDRSAILTAGRTADAVLWFDSAQPAFVTSTFYAKEVPAFVGPINLAIAAAVNAGAFAWVLPALPAGGITGASPVAPPVDKAQRKGSEAPDLQPLIDRFEVDLALAGVKALSMGKDDVPDLLAISFSGHDKLGHAFGAESKESVQDFEVVDREIGRLLDGLDQLVGKGRYVVAFSSDHGVAVAPALTRARGIDSGQLDSKAIKEALEAEADLALGPADWFVGFKTPGYTAAPANRAKLHTIDARLRKVAQAQPGVLDLLSQDELAKPGTFGSTGDLYRRGLVPGRSPDFIVVPKAYWTYSTYELTGHSSAWLYDRTVPLVFWGAGVKKGELLSAEAIDVAPTLARLLGIPAPAGSRGRVIPEVSR